MLKRRRKPTLDPTLAPLALGRIYYSSLRAPVYSSKNRPPRSCSLSPRISIQNRPPQQPWPTLPLPRVPAQLRTPPNAVLGPLPNSAPHSWLPGCLGGLCLTPHLPGGLCLTPHHNKKYDPCGIFAGTPPHRRQKNQAKCSLWSKEVP